MSIKDFYTGEQRYSLSPDKKALLANKMYSGQPQIQSKILNEQIEAQK